MRKKYLPLAVVLLPVFLFSGCTSDKKVTQLPSATEKAATITAAPTETPIPEPSILPVITEKTNYTTQTWIPAELTFQAADTYLKPFTDVQMDCVFTSPSGKKYTMPSFWDGDVVFKVRFAPTEYGIWTYKTVCTNPADSGLHNQTGTLACNSYTGDLEIYKRGFVTTSYGKKYFTYADGTPFFYLGDTHWSMYDEDIDSGDGYESVTNSHFKYVVDTRVQQGFTVYQSEPISSAFNLWDGTLNKSDVTGFQKADRYYQYLAEEGLVHANAEFFFSSMMTESLAQNTDYLEAITRYWVARFGAYPVMWTIAQEVDNNFYFEDNRNWYNSETNPWRKVCEWLAKYDPYHHPLTAHQEGADRTDVTGAGVDAKANVFDGGTSSFNNIPGHDWFAAQWKFPVISQYKFDIPKDYWFHTKKPAINYEGRYSYLWTRDFGARAQGWSYFLNGMFGYGYGVQGCWSYKNQYDITTDSDRDGISTEIVTAAEKQYYGEHWMESLTLDSQKQACLIKTFLEKLEWWKLVPNFNDGGYFSPSGDCFYTVAHIDSDVYVCYFYNQSSGTGKLQKLTPNAVYTAQWFNVKTGEYTTISNEISGETFQIPAKPSKEDWVLLVTKN